MVAALPLSSTESCLHTCDSGVMVAVLPSLLHQLRSSPASGVSGSTVTCMHGDTAHDRHDTVQHGQHHGDVYVPQADINGGTGDVCVGDRMYLQEPCLHGNCTQCKASEPNSKTSNCGRKWCSARVMHVTQSAPCCGSGLTGSSRCTQWPSLMSPAGQQQQYIFITTGADTCM